MVRVFLLGLILCCLGFRSASAQEVLTQSEIAKRTRPAVVFIQCKNSEIEAQGSGFVIAPDGKIVTALHVIQDMASCTVETSEGDTYDSIKVLAFDAHKDLAVIRIAATELPTIDIGDVSTVYSGDRALAIGNPSGLTGTVTAGIISAIRSDKDGFKWIQTDAAISPGSSGGPLLNSQAQAIGVIDWKFRGVDNGNFAIPINYVRPMLSASTGARTLAEMNLELREEKPVEALDEKPSKVAQPPKTALRPAVARLADVHVVYVGALGSSDGADVIREKIVNRLVKSGRVRVVIKPEEADAALIGGAEVFNSFRFANGKYGGGGTRHVSQAAVQLVNTEGEILWVAEGHTGSFVWSANTDAKIANGLLDAIKKDEKLAK